MKTEQRKQLIKQAEQRQAEVDLKVKEHLKKDPAHKMPVTRRDFLRIGAINAVTYVAAPSAIAMLAHMGNAQAAECVAATGSTLSPYFSVNMSGGWSLAGNWVPFQRNGDPLTDYTSLGVVSKALPTDIVRAFANNARFYATSNQVGFLAGIKSIPGATAAMTKAVFVGVPTVSMDDSSVNRMDPSGLVSRAGLAGTVLPPLGGSRTRTGVSHYAALGINPTPPLTVGGLNSIFSAVSFQGTGAAALNAGQQESMMSLIKKMSDRQLASTANLTGGQQFMDLVSCATGTNVSNVKNNISQTLNYKNDTAMNTIWGNDEKRASIIFNVLKGFSGAGGIDLGGYDYHDNLSDDAPNKTFATIRANQDRKNFEAGQLIGMMLASAAAMNKKMFLSIMSDGSVASGDGNTVNGVKVPNDARSWNGDSGNRGCSAFIAYDPAKAPTVMDQQIGGFAPDGTVDRTYITGVDCENAALAIFANWAKFSGDLGLYAKALPGNTRFNSTTLNEVVKLG